MNSLVVGLVLVLTMFGVGMPAVAVNPPPAPSANEIVRAGLDDFEFESFSADYFLDVDSDGRSTLTTVETFVALFPEFQNRGMRRAIPADYQGAPTDVAVQSVTDETGSPRPFTVETDDNGFVLVTSAENSFVSGRQTYVFTYTQRNVTRYFADTNDDEFFWDTNGTGWYQYFASVAATVHVPAELATSLNGQTACYRGYEGSRDTCELTTTSEAEGTVISTQVSDIYPFENVTVAIGFAPQTFVPRDDSFWSSPVAYLQIFAVLGGLAALIFAIVLRSTLLADGRGRPTIIAEYTPPDELDVITASVILRKTTRAAAAQFVDFAVKRKIRIVETEKKGWFSSGVAYLLELIDPTGLDGPPFTLAVALFGYQLQPGTGYLMSGRDVTLSQYVRAIIASATTAAKTDGYRKKAGARYGVIPALIAMLATVGSFVFGVMLLDSAIGGAWPFLLMVPPFIGLLVVFGLVFRTPLTDKGAEVRDHLKGLELYIRLAEADRLAMLQSPTGAQRKAIAPADPRMVLDIYEKLLPYAVLFGLEKQWAIELGKYYVDSSPEWYSGTGAFNAGVFASSISTMSTSAASSYSGSSSSSSSGGSGGGGSSGGGGGGERSARARRDSQAAGRMRRGWRSRR